MNDDSVQLMADDVRTLLHLYDEVVTELLRLDPLCQSSGWDTNDETKAAVDRVRAELNNPCGSRR